MAHEILDLIDRQRVAHAGIHRAALVLHHRAAAVDADQLALHVEERAAAAAGIDRRVDLDAVVVLDDEAGRVLVAMHAADHAEGDARHEVGGQPLRVAHGDGPVPFVNEIAVAQRGDRELLAFLLRQ